MSSVATLCAIRPYAASMLDLCSNLLKVRREIYSI